MAPEYLMRMVESMRNTRMGSDNTLLNIPQTKKKTFADRDFRVIGPRLWNSLPQPLREEDRLETFKKKLKTFLLLKY